MRKQLITLTIALIGSAVLSSAALAVEPKDEVPFTRVVVATTHSSSAAGEAKNELPFVRNVDGKSVEIVGEPKNEAPFVQTPDAFERYAAIHAYGRGLTSTAPATSSSDGSGWRDAVGGSIAAGILLLGLAGLERSRRRSHLPTPRNA
jgi:hypothetical protein